MRWIDTNRSEKRNVISMETLCKRIEKYRKEYPNSLIAIDERNQCLDLFDSNGNCLAQFLWEE